MEVIRVVGVDGGPWELAEGLSGPSERLAEAPADASSQGPSSLD